MANNTTHSNFTLFRNLTLAHTVAPTTKPLVSTETVLVSGLPTLSQVMTTGSQLITSLVLNETKNGSTLNHEDPFDYFLLPPFSVAHRVIASSILILIILVSLFGNTLVIMAFCRIRSLRSVTNNFIVSLSVADVLVTVGTMPLWTSHLIEGSKYIAFHDFLFHFWMFLDISCGTASITLLTVIAVERYFCISKPFSYHQKVTTKKSLVIILAISIYSIVLGGIGAVYGGEEVYIAVVPCLTLFIPLIIMGFCYHQIFSVAKYQMKKIEMTIQGKTKKFRLSREIRAAKVLAVVMGAFLICWGPFLLTNWYAIYDFENPNLPQVVVFTKCFHYFNSCLNPIIYACLNREFRNAFKKLLGFKKKPKDYKDSETIQTHIPEYSRTPSSDEKL